MIDKGKIGAGWKKENRKMVGILTVTGVKYHFGEGKYDLV